MELVRGGRSAPLVRDLFAAEQVHTQNARATGCSDMAGPMAGSRCGVTRVEAVPKEKSLPASSVF
jgi:hypothetical protein